MRKSLLSDICLSCAAANASSDHLKACSPLALAPVDDASLVAVKLHAVERAALVEIADRVGLQLGLLRHRMLAMVLAAAGRAVAELIGAMVVPPGAFVVRGAVEDLEMDVGMLQPDAAELHEILRLEPDRQPAVIERHLAE